MCIIIALTRAAVVLRQKKHNNNIDFIQIFLILMIFHRIYRTKIRLAGLSWFMYVQTSSDSHYFFLVAFIIRFPSAFGNFFFSSLMLLSIKRNSRCRHCCIQRLCKNCCFTCIYIIHIHGRI